MAKRALGIATLCTLLMAIPVGAARADDFAAGSLIIPMDTTYQDFGMFEAFGLLYELLRAGVPVRWVIREGKANGEQDFVASAVDHETGAVIAMHGYRGGPFVVDSVDAAAAVPIVDAWQTMHTTTVHVATAAFSGDVSRRLVAAPSIAMFADGNQDIARSYVVAAGIPDSVGNLAWPNASPDMLTVPEVSGPTTSNHQDGALFDADGDPTYCQIMSMHWGVGDARRDPEVVAEVRSFLRFPVHFFAECQAVNAFENDLVNGLFLTPYGFLIDNFDGAVDYYNQDQPFAQIDGAFELVGGSERAYTPCRDPAPAPCVRGGTYRAMDIVMMTRAGTLPGTQDVWMTGYVDGVCELDEVDCGGLGKVSYLGGHRYSTDLPISANPDSQGTRLFLQALFEAPCATSDGQPRLTVVKSAPAGTVSDTVTFSITVTNAGPSVATNAVLTDTLPAGTTFVSATDGGTFAGGIVTWMLGHLGRDESRTVSVTVRLSAFGTYENRAVLGYRVGLTPRTLQSNLASTVYGSDADGDGIVDSLDTCPMHANPGQDLAVDPDNCGVCGRVCRFPNAAASCEAGACVFGGCLVGFEDRNGNVADGCECAAADLTCGRTDGGMPDAGPATDSGPMADSGMTDSGVPADSGPSTSDSGGPIADSGSDSGAPATDAGGDSGGATGDSGTRDSGTAMADAGGMETDAGGPEPDAGGPEPDAAAPMADAGRRDGGSGNDAAARADGGSGAPGGTEDEGGCGCSTPGRARGGSFVGLGIAAALLALRRWRRRRRPW
ncbi:MAG: DUF11 domain-containing protein [Deltaproteobacteria bacterium]|nr:DUF11 domain-containing protein [Deltaproteobacteria bacterium]